MKCVYPNIEVERVRRGMKVFEIGALMNLKENSYRAKQMHGSFTIQQAKTLAKAFGCSVDYLFEEGSEDDEHDVQDDDRCGA